MEKVIIQNNKLIIDGKPRSLLCSSLFYFRIPRELWEDRMLKIKEMGYNTLDVYFPWNYHEREENKWEFTENRDVYSFLELARKHNMYVIARPGPYICSEWDMGGLPAYLLSKNLPLRQNDLSYLKYVSKWYNKILPILFKYQLSKEGTIIAIQIENELDFYNCNDVSGYMKKLSEMVKSFNFDIPVIACAGQGDICGATGYIEDVIPALNVYYGRYNRNFAYGIEHVKKLCDKLNAPLLVTETERNITMIRMLFGIGASLIAPYNQVGGSDYYYYNGLSNWGKPNAFMTSDYDFASLVTPDGEYGEQEKEAIVFKGIYKLFEPIVSEGNVVVDKNNINNEVHYIANKDNTKLHTFLNPEEDNITVNISGIELQLLPQHVHYVIENLLLAPYMDAEILLSTAEITNIDKVNEKVIIDVFTRTNSFISLQFNSKNKIVVNGDNIAFGRVDLSFSDAKESISIICDEKEILIKNYGLADIEKKAKKSFESIRTVEIGEITKINRTTVERQNANGEDSFLEDYGIFYGVGEYQFSLPNNTMNSYNMLLLENPGDIVNVYQDGEYVETIANGGFNKFVQIRDGKRKQFRIRAEIWGHSNFDDNVTPNTLLASKRGIRKIIAVTSYDNISELWFLTDLDGRKKYDWLQKLGSGLYVSDSFKAIYKKTVKLKEGNALYLYFNESEADYYVTVNNKFLSKVSKSGFLDISEFNSLPSIELEVLVEKTHHSCAASELFLIQGKLIENCDVKRVEVEKLENTELKQVSLPNIVLSQGLEYLVSINIKEAHLKRGIDLKIKGKDILIKAIANKKMYSRIFLSENENQSKVSGGNPNKMFLPNEILENGLIHLYVYAINQNSSLESIEYKIL
ncbi:beta-galactosidase [Clostridium hydrogenum]|uniref:beta-galactosidase n=1 Tax=Clostridium hydrogenum TaxID=2855764 RepID=UPI001F2382CC|nr:beta-galactosidase [Clostridium hydrogenum]